MKIKSADGLRGVAALAVAISHFMSAFFPMLRHKSHPTVFPENLNPSVLFEIMASPVVGIFYSGDTAVFVFFVLSGYVLTIPYFNGDASLPLKRRLYGRYLRLNLPIAAAVMLSYLAYRLHLYQNTAASSLSGSLWLQNYFPGGISLTTMVEEGSFKSILLGRWTFDPPLWTLRIEFIGSLFLLLYYLAKPQHKTVLPAAIVFLLLYAIYPGDFLFFMAIFMGSFLNRVLLSKKWTWAVFITGFYFGAFQFQCCIYDFLPSIRLSDVETLDKKSFYVCTGAVLMTAAIVNGFGRRVLESRFAQFLGGISFSLYLLHFIVLSSLACVMYIKLPKTPFYFLLTFMAYIVTCCVASKIFSITVDKPAIAISHKFSNYLFR